MKTFYISVTETLKRIVEVHAEDSSEALQKAEDAYYNEEIVLDSDTSLIRISTTKPKRRLIITNLAECRNFTK